MKVPKLIIQRFVIYNFNIQYQINFIFIELIQLFIMS